MTAKNVTARLDSVELTALRQLPGHTDAERMRNLVRSVGATDGLAGKIAAAVTQEILKEVTVLHAKSLAATEKKIQALEGKIHEEFGAVIRRLIEKMNQLSLGQKK